MNITKHGREYLEEFLEDIGGRYLNLVDDQVGVDLPQAYCCYLMASGLEGSIILIDGGNTFDPYAVTRYARLFSIDERRALSDIHLSRAFTCHQLTTLVNRKLEPALEEFGSRVVMVSEPASLYVERSAEEEVLEEFRAVCRRLLGITYRERLTAVVFQSYGVPRFVDGGRLERDRRRRAAKLTERVLFDLADSAYRVEKRPRGILISRLKNPRFPEGPAFLIPERPRMATLEEFVNCLDSVPESHGLESYLG